MTAGKPTEKIIRQIIALAGGDVNAPLPALKRDLHILAFREADLRVLVVVPAGREPQGSLVTLWGVVVAMDLNQRLIDIQTEVGAPLVTVHGPAGRVAQIVKGNRVLVQGRLWGSLVEATVLTVVSIEERTT